MIRLALAATLLLAAITAAHTFGLGKEGLMFGRLGAMKKGGGGAVVACTNRLDFSQACNSQYIPLI
jgi:hypothetical protein